MKSEQSVHSKRTSQLSFDSPYAVVDEFEPSGLGQPIPSTTIFLTATPCPIGCRMCDLHRNTLEGPTPVGALPRQIESALVDRKRRGWVKLYNSGNFFDPQSVPPQDYDAIANLCDGFSRVIVENHPRFGSERAKRFRDLISAQLEVAVGLETVQPRWLKLLEKQMTRDRFDQYARWLENEEIDLRVFLIVGAPGIPASEAIRWARLSVRHAVAQSARHISLIPARPGEGWSGLGDQLTPLSTATLDEIHESAIRDANGRAAVTIDLWDVDESDPLLDRIRQRNLTQELVRA